MRLMLRACLLLGMLAFVTQPVAAQFSPFLSVDFNGYNADSSEVKGPTQAGFQDFTVAQDLFADPSINWGSSGTTGLSNTYATSLGNITVNLSGRGTGQRIARNRGSAGGPLEQALQDIAFMTRTLDGFGQAWLRVNVSGLTPGQEYRVVGHARDSFNGGLASFQGWTDIAALGGLDGPGAWMDANVGVGALYQPTDAEPDAGTYKNPIPTLVRKLISGPNAVNSLSYAASFVSTADGGGNLTFYTWSDPDSYSGTQTATAIDALQLGVVPEPTSAILVALGLCGLAACRRRS